MPGSPRTMMSGAISLGLVTLPITIGKATGETKESAIVEVCDHRVQRGKVVRVDRSERCQFCKGAPQNKVRAVKVGDDDYRVLAVDEWNSIEAATKSDLLEIEDVQPLSELPMMYAIGTYYVRFNEKAKGADPDGFAHFVAALKSLDAGAIVKWGSSSNEKLCILHVESGVLLLRVIPFAADIRVAGRPERAHWQVELDERKLDKMTGFLSEIQKDHFDYAGYQNEALRLRQEAVDAVLKGEEPKQLPQHDEKSGTDWMAQLELSLAK